MGEDTASTTLISDCGEVKIDHLLNEAKSKVLSTLKILWTYLFRKKPKSIYSTSNAYFQAAMTAAPLIVSTLTSLGTLAGERTVETMTNNGYINTLVRVGIDVMCLLSREDDFRPFFLMNSFRLFLQVVMPYLRLSEKEREDMQDNPKEFVSYGIDICSKQKSRTYKSQASRLLEALIDNVDGMLTFAVDHVFQMMNALFTGESTVKQYVTELMTKVGLVFKSEEELLDVCFMVLSIVSYELVKRP